MVAGIAACVRQAWLTLGSLTMPLENPAGGWFCASLDLGYPEIREVIENRPDMDGAIDRTALMGARLITAEVHAVWGAGARIDDVADNFAPFMVPSARPVLHYILDRPGAAERTIAVRGVGYDWAVAGGSERVISLQWKAADPTVRDPTVRTVTAYAGTPSGSGRTYPLAFSRTYPTGGGGSSTGTISSAGDLSVRPALSIYGPVTGPAVTFTPSAGAASEVAFVPSFRIDQGHYVQVDTVNKTALLDGIAGQSVLAWLDWYNTRWPVLPPLPATTTMAMTGASTSNATQAVATWQDGYLT